MTEKKRIKSLADEYARIFHNRASGESDPRLSLAYQAGYMKAVKDDPLVMALYAALKTHAEHPMLKIQDTALRLTRDYEQFKQFLD